MMPKLMGSSSAIQGLALDLLQKCSLIKISGRGEAPALLCALCSSLNPPAHHKPNTPHGTLTLTLPASNQPATPQKSLHNTPFFICQHSGTQSGGKTKSSITSEGTLCPL